MKNLIITAGALLLMLTIMSYQFQLNSLLREKENLKFAVDEVASSAGLCFDEERFGDGSLSFDREKAKRKAEEIIRLNLMQNEDETPVSCKIEFFDEEGESPKVVVTLQKERIKAVSVYEHVPYG